MAFSKPAASITPILKSAFMACIWIILTYCPGTAEDKLQAYVSIPPQKFFVQSIAGDKMDVSVMVTPGANPHNYEPTPDQMKRLAFAKIYFAIGDPFEDIWLPKITAANPAMKIVHTEDGIAKKPVHRHESPRLQKPSIKMHSGHAHGIDDPHIWLSPPLVMLQARNILMGLIEEMPENREFFEQNYQSFISKLMVLDADFRTLFRGDARKEFLVFYSFWGYFADAYHLEQKSIEFEGKEPKAKELSELIQYARNREIRYIIVQPQFSTKHAESIAKEIHARLIFADPLAENWMDNLKSVAASLKEALR